MVVAALLVLCGFLAVVLVLTRSELRLIPAVGIYCILLFLAWVLSEISKRVENVTKLRGEAAVDQLEQKVSALEARAGSLLGDSSTTPPSTKEAPQTLLRNDSDTLGRHFSMHRGS